MKERPNPDDTEEPDALPEDAPVETPEADPRTEHAPDGGEPRSVGDQTDETDESDGADDGED
jgi:hypothetical protein